MDKIKDLQTQAQASLDAGDLDKAKDLIAQIKALKDSDDQKAQLADQLKSLTDAEPAKPEDKPADPKPAEPATPATDPKPADAKKPDDTPADTPEETPAATDPVPTPAEQPEDDPAPEDDPEKLKKQKGENRSMKAIQSLDNKTQDFANFIRTEGRETRSLDTTSGAVLVPVEVSTNVFELKDNQIDLSKYVTVQQVGTGQGKFPVAKRARAILATKEELAAIAEIDDPLFIDVEYKCATRIGQIALSNELLEDA